MESIIKLSSISKNINAYNTQRTQKFKEIRPLVIEVDEREQKNGQKYGKYMLKEGKTKVEVLAYGETYLHVKHFMKAGEVTKFPPGTFSCKPRNKKYYSNSTCKFYLKFLDNSNFVSQAKLRASTSTATTASTSTVNDGINDTCSIGKVSQLIAMSQPFTCKLKSIKFVCGEVHRYWGCKVCTYSIPRKHSDEKYYCKGRCNNQLKRKRKNGVPCERKICFRISSAKVVNNENETIDSLVLFDSACVQLFKKCGSEFETDNEAASAWKDLVANSRFDIKLTRKKKKKGSPYPASVIVETIFNVNEVATSEEDSDSRKKLKSISGSNVANTQELPSSTRTENEPESDSIYPDSVEYLSFGAKKKVPKPKFTHVDMVLQYRSDKYKETRYQIHSKPPGLVLLINNINFSDHEAKTRTASGVDIDLLQRGFRVMKYEIYGNKCHQDIKTKREFSDLLEQFKNELRQRDVDSFFVVISSHGRNNQISLTGPDEYVCVVEDLMIPFSDTKLPEYQGKPKVFMPLVCQNLGNKALGKSLDFIANHLFDMLVCCPSLPGYAQTRFPPEHGSLFVNLFVNNLMQYATSWHLKEILDKVQDDFKEQIRQRRLTLTVPHYIASTFGHFVLVPHNDENINPFQDMEVEDL